jgi:hypothetical protein
VREIDDLPATGWWGVQVRQYCLHTCTVHCTRAGILCSSALAGFEPTIPVFKRAKTFHALDRAATVTGALVTYIGDYLSSQADPDTEWVGLNALRTRNVPAGTRDRTPYLAILLTELFRFITACGFALLTNFPYLKKDIVGL